jgi:hypothetical protein
VLCCDRFCIRALLRLEIQLLSSMTKVKNVCSCTPPLLQYTFMARSLCIERTLPLVAEENLSKQPQLQKLDHSI